MHITKKISKQRTREKYNHTLLTPEMRCMLIPSTPLTSVTQINIIAQLNAHPRTSLWLSSFQYLLLSHILLMNCKDMPATGSTNAKTTQYVNPKPINFSEFLVQNASWILQVILHFCPLWIKRCIGEKQGRLDFWTTGDFLVNLQHVEAKAELQIIKGETSSDEKKQGRSD